MVYITKHYNPNHVPSKRYDLFIKALEKKVTEAENQIKKLQSLEGLYNLVREKLEQWDYDGDVKLDMNPTMILINIDARKTDEAIIFEDFCANLGKHLKDQNLHPTGEVSTSHAGFGATLDYCWRVRKTFNSGDFPPALRVIVNIPKEGLKDLILTVEYKTISYVQQCYTIKAKDPNYKLPTINVEQSAEEAETV